MEGFMIRGCDHIVPGCGGTPTLSRGATFATRWPHEPVPIRNQPVGLGFPHLAWQYQPDPCPFSTPGCWSCTCMKGVLIRAWDPIVPGCRWLYEPLPISDQRMEVGLPHRTGWCRPIAVFVTIVRGCRNMEGFMIPEYDPILPGCGKNVDGSGQHQSCTETASGFCHGFGPPTSFRILQRT